MGTMRVTLHGLCPVASAVLGWQTRGTVPKHSPMSRNLVHVPWCHWCTSWDVAGFPGAPRQQDAPFLLPRSWRPGLLKGWIREGTRKEQPVFSAGTRRRGAWQAAFLTDRPNLSNRKAVFSEPSKSNLTHPRSTQDAFQQPAAPVREIQRESPPIPSSQTNASEIPPGVSKQNFAQWNSARVEWGYFLYIESTQSSFTTMTFPMEIPSLKTFKNKTCVWSCNNLRGTHLPEESGISLAPPSTKQHAPDCLENSPIFGTFELRRTLVNRVLDFELGKWAVVSGIWHMYSLLICKMV